jgi:hypothetical protein
MENKLQNPQSLKKIFESLPQIDPRVEDLRAINYEILESIATQIELKAYLRGGLSALQDANSIVSDTFAKSSFGS